MENLTAVFVYGTLLQGQGNHRVLERHGARCLGEFKTVEKYRMTADGIPFVTDHDQVCQIRGEVYGVTDEGLRALDTLEGHPRFYTRRAVQCVSMKTDEVEVRAFLYFCDNQVGRYEIADGDFAGFVERRYQKERDHYART